jgi:predicted nucleotidyltransferase
MIGFKDRIRQNPYTRWILLLSNYVFQGIRHSSRTEYFYKIISTILYSIIFLGCLTIGGVDLSLFTLSCSLVLGHAFNWLLNGNISALLIHVLFLKRLNKEKLFDYLFSFQSRIESETWLLYSAAFGSLTRGDIKDSSDIDVTVVRYPGFMNGVKSLLFVLKEKKIAEFQGIPLEIYIDETPLLSKKRFGAEENPVVLYDPYCVIDDYYSIKQTIEEAREKMLDRSGELS